MKLTTTFNQKTLTMTSIEILDLLNSNRDSPMQLKHLHSYIKENFKEEIDGRKIGPSLNPNGTVAFYNIPEVESKMIVAIKDKNYLRQITDYWINKFEGMSPLDIAEQQLMALREQEAKLNNHEERLISLEQYKHERSNNKSGCYVCTENFYTVGVFEKQLLQMGKQMSNPTLRKFITFYESEIRRDGEHCFHKIDVSNMLIDMWNRCEKDGAFVKDPDTGFKFKADWLIGDL